MNLRVIYVLTVILLLISLNLSCAEHSENENYKFIIITPYDFIEQLKPLVAHKEHYGITTKIVTLNDIYDGVYFQINGRDNAEKIKYFIKESIENWNVNYVMLLGGEGEMPVRYLHTRSYLSPFISDLYYADIYNSNGSFCSWDSNNNSKFGEQDFNGTIDEVDLHPDVCIGRLLCDTSSEVENLVEKIIYYENNTYNKPWFNNLMVCGGNTKPILLDIFFKWFYLKGMGKIAYEGEYTGERVIENMTGFSAIRLYASSVLFNFNTEKILSCKNINNVINNGTGFVLFSGHGSQLQWGTHPPIFNKIWMPFPFGYTINDINKLEKSGKYPVVVFNACLCGDFSRITGFADPIAWKIINLENRGAIASFACTTKSLSLSGTLCTKTWSGYIATHIFKAYSEGKNIAGELLTKAINDYLDDEGAMSTGSSSDSHFRCMEYWVLLGDPTLKIGGYHQ